jgi:hypothetical protein
MFKNRFLVVIGVISVLLVTMAVSNPRPSSSLPADLGASDFYQRHPDWTWVVNPQNALIPVTGAPAFPDYFQRHPELSAPSVVGLGASDYFQRHPELSASVESSFDTTDYFFRHLNRNTSSLTGSFTAEQIRREYILGERYGVTPQGYAKQQALREYWLGERYGQTP